MEDELKTITKHSQPQANGFVIFDPMGASAITSVLQKVFHYGVLVQKANGLENQIYTLHKKLAEMEKKIYELENENRMQDRQLSDYDLLINQLLRNTYHADDRKRLTKLFVQHADSKGLKYDKGELLKVLLD